MTGAMAAAPLAGLRVLELGEWIAAPYATKLLADLGATVDKFEWGDGDPTRQWGPFAGAPDPEGSPQFGYLNTGKRSHQVDVTTTPGDLAARLVGRAHRYDVIVLDQHFLGRLPADILALVADANPSAVVTAITPFGLSGPHAHYRAYDLNVSTRGGVAYGVGDRGRPPLPLPMNQSEHHAGLISAIAIMMALIARDRDGLGQTIDLSSIEGLASLHTGFFLPLFVYGGGIVGCRNSRENAIPSYPNGVLPCRDGLFSSSSPKLEQWLRFIALMGTPEWTTLPRYRNRRKMALEYKAECDEHMIAWSSQHTKAELYEQFLAHRVPCAPLQSGSDLLANEHLAARDALVTLDLPSGGTFTAPRGPLRFSRSTCSPQRPPRLGNAQDDDEDDDDADGPAVPAVPRPPAGQVDGPPLAGVRVLDLGTAWAGGLAGRFLGDYGADVVKVESWSFMDGSRMGKPLLVDDDEGGDAGRWPDMQAGFHVHSRSKRSISLNLRVPEGRGVLLDLVRSADVLIHNFPAGVLDRLDLGPDTLLAVNPKLIVGGQSVAGGDGPASDYIGYAGTVAALSGLANAIGYEGEPPIGSFQGLYCDVISALTTALGVLVALRERSMSGIGQAVDVSQWEGTMALAAEALFTASTTGGELTSAGFHHPLLFPHATYPCANTDDGDPESAWVGIAVGSQQEWRGLVSVVDADGSGGLDQTWSLDDRRKHREVVEQTIARWTRSVDRYTAESVLQEAGVAATAVQSVADMFSDPQLDDRGSFTYLEHPLIGVEPMPGLPWRLSRTPGMVSTPAPNLGEHTRQVLTERLGLSDEEFARLVEVGAVELGPSV